MRMLHTSSHHYLLLNDGCFNSLEDDPCQYLMGGGGMVMMQITDVYLKDSRRQCYNVCHEEPVSNPLIEGQQGRECAFLYS